MNAELSVIRDPLLTSRKVSAAAPQLRQSYASPAYPGDAANKTAMKRQILVVNLLIGHHLKTYSELVAASVTYTSPDVATSISVG